MERSELEEIMRLVVLSVCVCVCVCVRPSVCLSVCLSVHNPSVCLSVHTSLGGDMHSYERLLVREFYNLFEFVNIRVTTLELWVHSTACSVVVANCMSSRHEL